MHQKKTLSCWNCVTVILFQENPALDQRRENTNVKPYVYFSAQTVSRIEGR